jgi:folylpolyglutamate synthase/dihydropteroate synthase
MVVAGSVTEAMRRAAREARSGDRIVVFGSFHTVGPALACV